MKNIFLITVFLVDRTLIHDQVSFNFLLTFRFSYLSGSTLVSETETSAPTTVHIYSNGEVKFYLKHFHTTILRVSSYVIFCQSHALLGLSIGKKKIIEFHGACFRCPRHSALVLLRRPTPTCFSYRSTKISRGPGTTLKQVGI